MGREESCEVERSTECREVEHLGREERGGGRGQPRKIQRSGEEINIQAMRQEEEEKYENCK